MASLLSGPLLPIFLIVFVDVLGLTLIFPLLPFYAEHLGASPTQVGLLVSTYAACQLFSGPLIGRLSDQYGRRRLLLLSQAGTLIGFFILAYARVLWVVFLSRVIDGITAGNISIAQAYIADVTKPEERTRAFALIGIAFGLGFLIGPAISGFLSQFGYVWPILLACLLSAASILATFFLLPETPSHAHVERASILSWSTWTGYFRRPRLGALLWQFFAYVFAFSAFMSGFALFAERRYIWDGRAFGAKEVGYVYAYIGLLGAIWQGMMGRLVRRFGEHGLVSGGFLISTLGLAGLAVAFRIPSLLVMSTVISIGSSVVRPALTSLITQETDRGDQGSILGLTQSIMSVAQIVAPFIGGVLIDHGHLSGWATFSAAAMAAGLALHALARRA